MLHDEEKITRLKQNSKQAIALAMQGRWQEAVEVNREILENFPGDIEAYNRLGRAYLELGEHARAKEAYSSTLERDPYNAIARKNIQRLSYLKEAAVGSGSGSRRVEPHHFIEEMGKTGVVSLYDLAPKEVLAAMVAGNNVHLKVEGSSLLAENSHGEYLGRVDPRHAQRLIKLMEGGNKYSAAVVSSVVGSMTVMIREVYQDPSQAGRLSFPPKGLAEVRPFISDRALKIEADQEAGEARESGYTIIGGDEIEVLPEENSGVDEDAGDNED